MNCLADGSKMTRKRSLKKLSSVLLDDKPEPGILYVTTLSLPPVCFFFLFFFLLKLEDTDGVKVPPERALSLVSSKPPLPVYMLTTVRCIS